MHVGASLNFTVGVSFSVGGRVISYGSTAYRMSFFIWCGRVVSCELIFAIYKRFLFWQTALEVVRTDMAAVCKYCVVIAVAVSAIFLSSQQADTQ